MAENVLADAGFVVALLSRRDAHHGWSVEIAERFPPPWQSCEAAVSEAYHLLGAAGAVQLRALLGRGALVAAFDLTANLGPVLGILEKYQEHGASVADACLVRMTEILAAPLVLTTDTDFRLYRRHGRQVVPCQLPR